jgi:hypothetical protein
MPFWHHQHVIYLNWCCVPLFSHVDSRRLFFLSPPKYTYAVLTSPTCNLSPLMLRSTFFFHQCRFSNAVAAVYSGRTPAVTCRVCQPPGFLVLISLFTFSPQLRTSLYLALHKTAQRQRPSKQKYDIFGPELLQDLLYYSKLGGNLNLVQQSLAVNCQNSVTPALSLSIQKCMYCTFSWGYQ